jgi:hypothetical protein
MLCTDSFDSHKDTELSISLPFRLLNLPAGAKLEIKRSKSRTPSQITIKIQFINSPFAEPSVVKKLSNSITLRELIESLESQFGPILNQGHVLKIQTFTKSVGEDDLDLKLLQIGVENNGVLRVRFSKPVMAAEAMEVERKFDAETQEAGQQEPPKGPIAESLEANPPTVQPLAEEEIKLSLEEEAYKNILVQQIKEHFAQAQAEEETSHEEETPDTDPMDVEAEPVNAKLVETEPEEVPKHIYVYKPSSAPVPIDEPDESAYEVTVSHARQYQNMLSSYAHDSEKKKRLRKEASKRRLTNIEVRVRFPDQSILQANFKPTETNRDLYGLVKNALFADEEFELCIPYPQGIIKNNDDILTTQLETRNLLLYRSERKTGIFLKQEYLQQAKDIQEAEEVKLDRFSLEIEEREDDGKIHNGILPKKSHSSTSSKLGKKVPRWLKLGKK